MENNERKQALTLAWRWNVCNEQLHCPLMAYLIILYVEGVRIATCYICAHECTCGGGYNWFNG